MKINKTDTAVNDELLWENFLAGSDKAYTEIYKRYIGEVFSYGLRFTSDVELLEDCLQDVFVKIYSNRSNLGKTDNIKLYLYTALKNTLFNVFQKDKTSYHIDTLEPVFTVEYSPEDRLIADEWEQEQKDKMNLLLETLTPRQKEVIFYRYMEGMKIEEICKIMDMNYQSVLNLVQRSIKKIKSTLPEKDHSTLNINLISKKSI